MLLIDYILEWKKLHTMKVKYLAELPKYPIWNKDAEMNRIHASVQQVSSPTGRLSYVEPNLQCVMKSVEFTVEEEMDMLECVISHHRCCLHTCLGQKHGEYQRQRCLRSQERIRLLECRLLSNGGTSMPHNQPPAGAHTHTRTHRSES